MNNIKLEHTFVVPAYGFSPHLAECLNSLRSQRLQSEIFVSTSTLCSEVEKICDDFGVKVHVHSPNRGIGNDWNQAVRLSSTPYVTLAHQDDVYYPGFSEETLRAIKIHGKVALAFTNYEEITSCGTRSKNRLLMIKQALLRTSFLGRNALLSKVSKRNVLRFACPIPCPAVTINTSIYPVHFNENLHVNLDWDAWLRAADKPGAFVWIRKILMGHRIHESSETSAAISDGRRANEDYMLLKQLWPDFMAKKIVDSYDVAYRSNSER